MKVSEGSKDKKCPLCKGTHVNDRIDYGCKGPIQPPRPEEIAKCIAEPDPLVDNSRTGLLARNKILQAELDAKEVELKAEREKVRQWRMAAKTFQKICNEKQAHLTRIKEAAEPCIKYLEIFIELFDGILSGEKTPKEQEVKIAVRKFREAVEKREGIQRL